MSLQELGIANYYEYIASPQWAAKRAACIERDGCCRGCGAKEHLQAHHCSYGRLGREKNKDLVTLCRNCHERVHEALDRQFPDLPLSRRVKQTAAVFPKLFGSYLWSDATPPAPRIRKKPRKKRKVKKQNPHKLKIQADLEYRRQAEITRERSRKEAIRQPQQHCSPEEWKIKQLRTKEERILARIALRKARELEMDSPKPVIH